MSDNKPKRIIGKRVRLVIGNEVPKEEDEDSTVIGQDTLTHVRPEEIEEGTQVVGEQITLIIGDSRPADIIKAVMKRAQETDPIRSKEIVELGKSALNAEDKPTFKSRLMLFINKCKDWAPLAALVVKLIEIQQKL
jgi:hypothetical protein